MGKELWGIWAHGKDNWARALVQGCMDEWVRRFGNIDKGIRAIVYGQGHLGSGIWARTLFGLWYMGKESCTRARALG